MTCRSHLNASLAAGTFTLPRLCEEFNSVASSASSEQPRYLSPCEILLALLWFNEDEESVEEIGRRLRRCVSTLWRLFGNPGAERGFGRKAALSGGDKERLVKLTEDMVDEADCCCTVTMALIAKRFRIQAGIRCLPEALHEGVIWFPTITREAYLNRW